MAKFSDLLPPTDEESDLQKVLNHAQLTLGGGSQPNGINSINGRLGYNQPIDDTSSINAGVSGHAMKGKGFSDAGLDHADIAYQKKLASGNKISASLGAGRGGVDSAKLGYEIPFKKGGKVKAKPKTSTVRGHGIERRGKTKGRFV